MELKTQARVGEKPLILSPLVVYVPRTYTVTAFSKLETAVSLSLSLCSLSHQLQVFGNYLLHTVIVVLRFLHLEKKMFI